MEPLPDAVFENKVFGIFRKLISSSHVASAARPSHSVTHSTYMSTPINMITQLRAKTTETSVDSSPRHAAVYAMLVLQWRPGLDFYPSRVLLG